MNYLFVAQSNDATIQMGLQRPGVAYVASSLRAYGYNVFGIELSFVKNEEDALREEIYSNCIDVVCIGALSEEFNQTYKIIECVKTIKANIITIVGGGLVTTNPELVLKNIKADFGVIGQGEITICELADAIKNKTDYSLVDGIIYSKNDVMVKTKPRRELDNIDNLNYPLYEIFSIENSINMHHRIDIVASRSCPHRCTFCYHPSGSSYVQRSMDSIFDEIDYWIGLFKNIRYIGIVDELFAANEDRVREFCKRIKKYNINFRVQLRVSDVNKKVLKQLYDAGCDNISYGLESADDSILKSMRKNTTLLQIEEALRLTKEHNIFAEGNFIFGDIAENIETANKTFNWWLNHLEYNINLTLISVYPGTFLYNYAIEHNIITDELKYLQDGCPIINVSKLSESEFNFIKRRISTSNRLKLISVSDIVINKIIDIDGTLVFEGYAECMSCGKTVEFNNLYKNKLKKIICPSCRSYLQFTYNSKTVLLHENLISSAIDMIFKDYADQGKRIIIWGASERTESLLISSDNLLKCTKKVVDINYKKINRLLNIYDIQSPDIIKYENIDCILITVVRKKDEVINTIKKIYKLDINILVI